MVKYSIGLKSLKMGEIAADGGMGTALTDFGGTFKGTATLTQEDAQKTEFYVDEMPDPVIVSAQPGKKTLAFTVINLDPDNLERRKTSIESKLAAVNQQMAQRKDNVPDFKEMGIDHIFVDESHQFKNLTFTTKHHNVAGLGNPQGSQRT
jgi:N12 class adenine-specific DNA methylase